MGDTELLSALRQQTSEPNRLNKLFETKFIELEQNTLLRIDEKVNKAVEDLGEVMQAFGKRLPALNCVTNEDRVKALEAWRKSVDKDLITIKKQIHKNEK